MKYKTMLDHIFVRKTDFPEYLKGVKLAAYLKKYPEDITKCKYSTLDGYEWSVLLSIHPQLKSYCDFSTLTGRDWCRLLKYQPMFLDVCDWATFDEWDLHMLVSLTPEIIQDNVDIQEMLIRNFRKGIKFIPNAPPEMKALHDILWEL